jgi:hypothetical protein
MTLHASTFETVTPTADQIATMDTVRQGFTTFAKFLDDHLPDGPDKTYLMRQLRDCAMWANVTIIRQPDGAPR